MSGKGSGRRPQEAPDEQVADNWARIFGSKAGVALMHGDDGKPVWADLGNKAQADHKDVE